MLRNLSFLLHVPCPHVLLRSDCICRETFHFYNITVVLCQDKEQHELPDWAHLCCSLPKKIKVAFVVDLLRSTFYSAVQTDNLERPWHNRFQTKERDRNKIKANTQIQVCKNPDIYIEDRCTTSTASVRLCLVPGQNGLRPQAHYRSVDMAERPEIPPKLGCPRSHMARPKDPSRTLPDISTGSSHHATTTNVHGSGEQTYENSDWTNMWALCYNTSK